jgi:plastocyanin
VRRLTIPVAVLVAVSFLGLAGCKSEGGGDVTPDSTAPPNVPAGQVLVKSISFTPKEVRTTVGTAVTWTFDDGGLEHTVTADDNSFDSGRKSSGTFPHAFTTAGTFNYHCQIHAKMHGTVVVTG